MSHNSVTKVSLGGWCRWFSGNLKCVAEMCFSMWAGYLFSNAFFARGTIC